MSGDTCPVCRGHTEAEEKSCDCRRKNVATCPGKESTNGDRDPRAAADGKPAVDRGARRRLGRVAIAVAVTARRTSFVLLLSDGKAHHQRNRHIEVDRHTNILVSLSRLLYQVGAFHNLQGEALSLNPGHVACEICFAQPVDDAQKIHAAQEIDANETPVANCSRPLRSRSCVDTSVTRRRCWQSPKREEH
jgi:hypothetical protein